MINQINSITLRSPVKVKIVQTSKKISGGVEQNKEYQASLKQTVLETGRPVEMNLYNKSHEKIGFFTTMPIKTIEICGANTLKLKGKGSIYLMAL